MLYAFLAIMILTYPIGSGIAYGALKIIELLANKVWHPARFVTASLPLFLVILIYPVHWYKESIDVALPIWMLLFWHFESGAVNYFIPETLFGAGYGWGDSMPGLIYKVIWLILFMVAIRKCRSGSGLES